MSAAEELRAAATRLRETASSATPGPWAREADTDHDGYGANFIANWNGPYLQGVGDTGQGEQADRDAAWIALASPLLAEPLAALLEEDADNVDWLISQARDAEQRQEAKIRAAEMAACSLAVARTINGGAS